jgi:hypothetical protein
VGGYMYVYVCKKKSLKGFLPQLDEFYFTTAEKKILEKCRCTVPNLIND